MYWTVLVPLDGSELAEQALPLAATLAEATRAKIVLVRAVSEPGPPGTDPRRSPGHAMATASLYLTRIAERLQTQGLDVIISTPARPADSGILSEIERQSADLVVMTTHGRSGLGRCIYGSVAEAVLKRSPAPVWLIRAGAPAALETPTAPRVVVPLDGSSAAEAVLPHVTRVATALSATVALIRAVTPRVLHLAAAPFVLEPYYLDEVLRHEQAEARDYLEAIAERFEAAGVRTQAITRVGPAADIILQESRRPGTLTVMMATHGLTGFRQALFGSVTREVVRRAVCPVFLLHTLPEPKQRGERDRSTAAPEFTPSMLA